MQDRIDPTRATRLVLDLKTGGAYPSYAEDNRFYALLLTLRFGVPPYRVASLFLESGEWQAEDVTERSLFHAADRVIEAVRASAALLSGREPALTPGHYCGCAPGCRAGVRCDPGYRWRSKSNRIAHIQPAGTARRPRYGEH